LANVYVSEGNEIYRNGAEILNAANTKVNEGAYTTEDDAYKAELAKAKPNFAKHSKRLKMRQNLILPMLMLRN
jgi:hypothetical protein